MHPIRALHHNALEEVTTEYQMRLMHPPVKRKRIGVIVGAHSQRKAKTLPRAESPVPLENTVGAHYDSVIDVPCADDNAAAVAIALAAGNFIAAHGTLGRDSAPR